MVVKGGREEEKDRHKHRGREGVGVHHAGDQSLVLPAALHFSLEEKNGTVGGRRGVWIKKNRYFAIIWTFCSSLI